MLIPLSDVESAIIRRYAPPINLDKNPGKLPRLNLARKVMAAEATRWQSD